MLVGIIADTHIPHRLKAVPQAVFEIFSEVDLILHAGDIVDPRILEDLASLAPVKAVRGNVHLVDRTWDPQLPKVQRLHILGHHIVLTHGHGSLVRGSLERVRYWLSRDRDLVNQRIANWCLDIYPEADLIIFGHSHRAYNQRFGRRLLFNPGAVCPTEGEMPSVALLTIEREKVSGELVGLTQNKGLHNTHNRKYPSAIKSLTFSSLFFYPASAFGLYPLNLQSLWRASGIA